MKRLIYWPLVLMGILGFFHLLLTGSPIPRWITESLASPRKISSIEENFLRTSEGTVIRLRGAGFIRECPPVSADIFKHGVEVNASGEMFGLVRVHHWCGNDPVRYHLARVSLISLVAFLEEGQVLRVSKHGIDPWGLRMLGLPPDKLKEELSERHDGRPTFEKPEARSTTDSP